MIRFTFYPFLRVFFILFAITGHYHAWNTGKVLHRDVNKNNLMIYQGYESQ